MSLSKDKAVLPYWENMLFVSTTANFLGDQPSVHSGGVNKGLYVLFEVDISGHQLNFDGIENIVMNVISILYLGPPTVSGIIFGDIISS